MGLGHTRPQIFLPTLLPLCVAHLMARSGWPSRQPSALLNPHLWSDLDPGEAGGVVYGVDRNTHGLLGAGAGRSARRVVGTAFVRIAAVGERIADIHGAVEVGSRGEVARRARAIK